jgi:hypothetical protein
MKSWLIILNIAIFFIGNTFAASAHYYNHEDSHHHEQEYDCQECINIENSSNFVFDFDTAIFSDNNKTLGVFENSSIKIKNKIATIFNINTFLTIIFLLMMMRIFMIIIVSASCKRIANKENCNI